MRIVRSFAGLFLLLAFVGCSSKPLPVTEESYYYWKPLLRLTTEDGLFFQKQKIKRLYVRFFDLDWDPKARKLFPRAVLHSKDTAGLPPEVVPVVYVTTDALRHLKPYAPTARFVLRQVQNLAADLNRPNFPEIQMDGDWTPSTREGYFSWLAAVKKQMGKGHPAEVLSATIRLHQVKYRRETGVPPVDRGILMVYHTSAPEALDAKNSILDETDARDYLKALKDYPLSLDAAFPLFCWGAHFNQVGRFLKVFRIKQEDPEIARSFAHLGGPLYQAREDVYLGGFRFMKDDYLKVETSNPKAVEDLKKLVLEKHPNNPQRVIWFEYSYKREGL